MESLAFYLFAGILLASAVLVVASRNPVHSVLFLILSFFNAGALFVLVGAEFLAMILVIVYVGAVAVLFLFVVMMLDVDYKSLRSGVKRVLPIGLTVGAILLVELVLVMATDQFAIKGASQSYLAIDPSISNTKALGQIMYTKFIYLFQACGLVLLVAMIGAIVLTMRQRDGVRRQDLNKQISRKREDVIEIEKVQPGSGAL